MNHSPPLGLAALEQAVRRDLEMLNLPAKDWVPRHPGVRDVVVVGAGMNGIAAAGALKLKGIRNIEVLEAAPPGQEGPWVTYARMETLRSPKNLTGPCFGIPSLTYRAWHEASFGLDAWNALYKIPNQDWQDYLGWLQRMLHLPIRHGVTMRAVQPADGLLRVVTDRGAPILARRVVLATGRGAVGGMYWPGFVPEEMRPDLAAHTNDMIDFARLQGKSLAVIGAGPSALDNAAVAMINGAASADVYVRRKVLPQINKGRGTGLPYHYGWGDLPDEDRWQVMTYIQDLQAPPPHETVHRVMRLGVHIHLDMPTVSVRRDGDKVVMRFADGSERVHDFLIVGTGFLVDMDRVPELAAFAPHIARWADRYVPPPELVRHDLAAFPYLGAGFELLPRDLGAPPELKKIHLLNYGAHTSFGGIASDIPAVAIAGERVALAILRGLFREDFSKLREELEAFDEPELESTPFFVPR
jgi:cation diffusion facilitator CzcD-associated flavoprotein CzcO